MRLFATVCMVLCCATPLPAEEVQWRDSYAKGIEEAKEQKKPIFLFFTTTNCVPCARMKGETFKNQTIVYLLNVDFVSVQVKSDEHPTKEMGIDRFPTLVIAASDGTILETPVGFQDGQKLKNVLERRGRP